MLADRQTRGQARRLNAGRVDEARIVPVPGDEEISERDIRRMELRPDAAAAKTQIANSQFGEQTPRRFDKVFDRNPLVLVVVFPIEVANGRAKRDVAMDGLAQMNAQA